ncbi:MAG: ABC transporter ATP-binding protein [Eubacteriales bacterium]|nr:ABC transporter ATP-binding protein [Eubacteriales bacterium]
MENYFEVEGLTVGYDKKPLIKDITFGIDKGSILTLIGPNGSGKSTILKTITGQLAPLGGRVAVEGDDIFFWTAKQFAQRFAVVLTERIKPELVTCAEIVAMGRYPYTDLFGRLTDEDKAAVANALRMVHAMDLANRDFSTLSDGQRQRILLARAICQDPEVIVLDEPTAYLDIRHKIELLEILRRMAREKHVTVIMSLHEIDLAMKISDNIICVKGESIQAFGSPQEIIDTCSIEELYEIKNGSYDTLFGSVELVKPSGEPKIFIVAGGGHGIPFYRELQKRQIPFATGVLFSNDVDYQVARTLSDKVIVSPAFESAGEEKYKEALDMMLKCSTVIDAGTPCGSLNEMNSRLLEAARDNGIPVLTSLNKGGSIEKEMQ